MDVNAGHSRQFENLLLIVAGADVIKERNLQLK
jgi:hypothetical protein